MYEFPLFFIDLARQVPTIVLSNSHYGADKVPTRENDDVVPTDLITKRLVDAAEAQRSTYLIRDIRLKGFVLVVTPYGGKSYAVEYRAGRGRRAQKRRYTIGKHGSPWTPELARREALRLLGAIANGADPTATRNSERQALTLTELCDLYLAEGTAHKKKSTLKADCGRIVHHLKPLLGRKRVDAIDRRDIERLMIDVTNGKTAVKAADRKRQSGSTPKGGRGAAAQCVALLSTIFAFAIQRRLRGDNPAHGIKKPPVRKMERFLSEQEFTRLATALDAEASASNNPYPSAAIKLLLLTGCRRSEILNLRWQDIDFDHQCLRLPDSKTGAKVVYLNAPALIILRSLPNDTGNPNVIAGNRQDSRLVGIDKVWFRIRKNAGLDDVRLHDLRHSFASVGAIGGLSLPIIGALLGHKHAATTSRYAHLSAHPIRAANEMIGARIAAAMHGAKADVLTYPAKWQDLPTRPALPQWRYKP